MEKIITDTLKHCDFIRTIILSDGVTEIEKKAFYKCRNLESVVIPETVTKIGSGAFAWSGLKSIILPGRLTEIGEKAFSTCGKLETVVIPDSVTKIGPYAFADSGLKSITLPYGVEIGEDAFRDCSNLVVNYIN